MPRRIEIVDYDPGWAVAFEDIRWALTRLLGASVLEIEHVGSTSVPGLCAKPKIDVDVVVGERAAIASAVRKLQGAGYDYHGDPHKSGMWTFTGGQTVPSQRVYVCLPNTAAHLDRLCFRDYLMSNPHAADEYARLKRRLADEHRGDVDAYTEAKGPFVAEIVKIAHDSAPPAERVVGA